MMPSRLKDTRWRGAWAARVLLGVLALCAGPARAEDLAAFDDRVESGLAAACRLPAIQLGLPNGKSAGRADMVDAMQAVKQFDADTTAYTGCIQQRMAALAAAPAATAVQKAAIDRIGVGLVNDAVDRAERTAAAFNEEVRLFKTRPQDRVGLRYVPAQLKTGLQLEGCVPESLRGMRAEFRMRVSVDVDGHATVEEITPLDVAASLFPLAACASGKLDYSPARRDGVAEAAEVWIPVRLAAYAGQLNDEVSSPTLASTGIGFVAATSECYPEELRAAGPEGEVKLKLTLSPGGTVRAPQVAAGSGNAALDTVARCIVRRLRFTPVLVNGQPQEVEILWTLPVKPPAAWLKPGG